MTLPTSSGPGPVPESSDDQTTRDRVREQLQDKRVLAVIGAAALGVVLLGAFVVVPALTSSSSSDSALPAVHKAVHHTTTAATASATPSALPSEAVPPTVRDPFSALLATGAANAVATSAPSSAGVTTTLAPQSLAPASTAAAPSSQSEVSLIQVLLAQIGPGSTANVSVNGLPYVAKLNQPFANGITMTAITPGNATFTYRGQKVTLVPRQFALFAGPA